MRFMGILWSHSRLMADKSSRQKCWLGMNIKNQLWQSREHHLFTQTHTLCIMIGALHCVSRSVGEQTSHKSCQQLNLISFLLAFMHFCAWRCRGPFIVPGTLWIPETVMVLAGVKLRFLLISWLKSWREFNNRCFVLFVQQWIHQASSPRNAATSAVANH